MSKSWLISVNAQILRAELPDFDIGTYEQNVIVYLMKTNPAIMERVHLSHVCCISKSTKKISSHAVQVYFEIDYCLNCWYKDVHLPHIPQPPFVIHFAGCQLCTGFHPERLGECERELVREYTDTHSQLRELAGTAALH